MEQNNKPDRQYSGTKGLSLAIVIGVALGTVIGKYQEIISREPFLSGFWESSWEACAFTLPLVCSLLVGETQPSSSLGFWLTCSASQIHFCF